MHKPVLVKEVLKYLNPKPNQNFVDATVGDGGHTMAVLEKIAPKGKILAIDRDSFSINNAKSIIQNSKFKDNVIFINDSFGSLKKIIANCNFKNIKGILFDFGMSSSQLENSGRGFSFQKDEILDMRYDVKNSVTAEDVVNSYNEKELMEIFKKFSEEPYAAKIARVIVQNRRKNRIKTTGELARIVSGVVKKRNRIHPATLIFQALRIEVNQEFGEIEKALQCIPEILLNGGRAAFISFHSLEDRLIKNWSKSLNRQGKIKIINKKPVAASPEELKINPRSRSARLRIIEKNGYPAIHNL